jgi:asparagine synthase (glutamine-hydrolysing)
LVSRYCALPTRLRQALIALARGTAPLLGTRATSLRRLISSADLGLPDAYFSWLSYVSPELRSRSFRDTDEWALDAYRAMWTETDGLPLTERLLNLNLRTYLLDDLLPKVDRMSMAHALEVRSPFLDVHLLEFVASLPPTHKLMGFQLKRVLRRAVEDLVPRPLLHRPKRGFGVPLARWFREDLGDILSAHLTAADARLDHHIPGQLPRWLVDEHRRGQADHSQALWALLTLELFLRREGW